MTLPVPALEPAFDVVVRLAAPQDHGVTRAGHRRVVPIVGGAVTGALDAEILPGGGDWQTIAADGTITIDGRYSARTAEGELVYLQVHGIRTAPQDVLAALSRGEAVDPAEYYFRTTVAVETSAPRLAHLERSLFIAACARDADAVRYRAYRVT